MEALWAVIGVAVGVVAGAALIFAAFKARLGKAEADVATERSKAEAAEAARQTFDLELATARVKVERVTELTTELQGKTTRALQLEKECSSLRSTIEEREKALAEERELIIRRETEISSRCEERTTRVTQLEIECSSMRSTIEEREKALAEERELINQLKEQFKAQFAELSASALKVNSETFLDTAKRVLKLQSQEADTDLEKRQKAIEQLVKPIQEGIKAVGDAAKEMESKREKVFGTIEEQIKQSVQQSAEVARQTGGLKDALKKPNIRGRWGEVQLKNCIELAGMEEHCDVEFQESSVGPDEDLVRPDMTVRMPGGRKIAVDSKTPMIHFLAYIEAATDEERNSALILHGRAVKGHVASLARADYMQKVAGSPDFVVMFLPNESFLSMALEKEPALMEDALNKKVLVTTPGTLIGLLKVIRYGWNEQKIALNAQLIAEQGAKLNTEITRFLEDFAKLGKAIHAASDAYNSASRRVEKQITNAATKLTDLGAKSRKALTGKARLMLPAGESDQNEGGENGDVEE